MKNQTIAISIIIIAAIIFALFYFLTNQDQVVVDVEEQTSESVQVASYVSDTAVDEEGRMLLGVGTDMTIAVNDVRIAPDTLDMGFGQYQLIDLVNNPQSQYGILYDDANQVFLIAVRTEDEEVVSARDAAFTTLKNLLNITTEELCQLNITITLAHEMRSDFAGQELTLLGICD